MRNEIAAQDRFCRCFPNHRDVGFSAVKRPPEAPEGWCPQIWVFEGQKSSNLCPEIWVFEALLENLSSCPKIWVFEGRFYPSWDKLG
jgi:hypothetical protein